jgi:micrococcal nuclease
MASLNSCAFGMSIGRFTRYRPSERSCFVETLIVIAAYCHCFPDSQRRDECVGVEFKWDFKLLTIRRWAYVVFLLSTILGCKDSVAVKSLPAPIHDRVEYVTVGRVPRVGGGDHFELGESGVIHYVVIRGVDSPKPGQSFYREAQISLWKMTKNKDIRAEVVDREESMIEVADVFVINDNPADIEGDLNVALALIRQGLGWFDRTEFEGSELYRQAELEAKINRIGLWSEPNPVPPWEFESARQTKRGEQLKF